MAGIINHAVREHGAKQDIKRIAKPLGLTGAWSWQHDPERYAIDNFTKAKEDAGFKNTNIPPGYVYKPWSIDGLMAQVRSDELHLDGEWD